MRIWVDDALVADSWADPSNPVNRGVVDITGAGVSLTAGKHRIRTDAWRAGPNDSVTDFGVLWTRPDASQDWLRQDYLRAGLGLVTKSTTYDATTGVPTTSTKTVYDRPQAGTVKQSITDPDGLALTETSTYEPVNTGWQRQTSRTLPAGNQTTYQYWGDTETHRLAGQPTVWSSTGRRLVCAVNDVGMSAGLLRWGLFFRIRSNY